MVGNREGDSGEGRSEGEGRMGRGGRVRGGVTKEGESMGNGGLDFDICPGASVTPLRPALETVSYTAL